MRPYNLTISHLGSMPVRVASHALPIYMLLKHFGGQRLSKRIHEIICRCYLSDRNVTSLRNLSDQMIFSLYMLLAFTASGFLGLGDCPAAVTVNCEWLSRQRYHSKSYKESFEPNCFLSCFTSHYIFSLQGGISGTFMFNTPLADSSASKHKHKPKSWYPGILIWHEVEFHVCDWNQLITAVKSTCNL